MRKWLFLLLAILLLGGLWRFLSPRKFRRECDLGIRCCNHLRQLGLCIQIYADDNRNAHTELCLPPSLKTMIDGNYFEESVARCPLSGMEYKFVPYRILPNDNIARHTPVLLEQIGCHVIHSGVPWKKGLSKTNLAFADGRCITLENLTCYMDIYRLYGPSLSEENAAILKQCCQQWDAEAR
ncbi:MAG: hypothetical protein IJJ26_03780 [Victivallales bacterium]|nr:hypothetical protein [Victivallales bacterium]